MTNDYSTEAMELANAVDAVFENKQVNKKNDISGDFSTDNESYATVKAIKNQYEGNGTAKNAHVHGNITTDGKISGNTDSDKIVGTTTAGALTVLSNLQADKVVDANANNYNNMGSLTSGANLQTIFSAINTVLGTLKNLKFIEVTKNKGTASADTLNKLYIVEETVDNKTVVNIYYTVATESGGVTTYDWEKMDSNILDELVINWSDIQGKPTFISQTDIDNNISDFASQLAEAINPTTP